MGIGLHVYVQLMHPQSHIGTQSKSIKIAAKHLCFVQSKDLHYEDKKDSRP